MDDPSALQWGRSVNAAETRGGLPPSARVPRFNGAAALTLRKQWIGVLFDFPAMRFNGAAALTLRKLAHPLRRLV